MNNNTITNTQQNSINIHTTENSSLLPHRNQEAGLSQRISNAFFEINNTVENLTEEQMLYKKIEEWKNQGGNEYLYFDYNKRTLIQAFRNNERRIQLQWTPTLPDIFHLEKFKNNITSFSTESIENLPPSFGNLSNLRELKLSSKSPYNLADRSCYFLTSCALYLPRVLTTLFCLSITCPFIACTRGICAPFTELSHEITGITNNCLWSAESVCTPPTINLDVLKNFRYLRVLHLRIMPLTNLPESIRSLTTLKELIFSTYEPSLIPEWIDELTTIDELELGNSASMPVSIGNMRNLKSLFIHDVSIPLPDSMQNLTSLIGLNLHSTRIKKIPLWVNRLVNLKKLSLVDCGLNTIHECLLDLPSLIILNLENNKLTDISDWFGNLNLFYLNVSNNLLKKIPEPLKKMTSLRDLSITSASIECIPDWIGCLSQLQCLYLDHNKITHVPDSIGSLSQLEILNLSYNNITQLTNSIGNLSQLEYLNLSNNNISLLPDSIGNFYLLETIYLSNNNLTVLPPSIGNLHALQNFTIYDNSGLRSLPITLGNCSNLIFFDISDTSIPQSQVNAIFERSRLLRDENNIHTFSIRLNSWLIYSKNDRNFNFLLDENLFSAPQQQAINEWLLRLEVTKDFNNAREPLAVLVCKILDSLKLSTSREALEFKNAFFGHLDGNLADCGDRAAMLLNLIYTDWQLLMVNKNASDSTKMELLVGIAKTLTLRKILQEHFQYLREGRSSEIVENYLYYETKLKHTLGLVTAIDAMIYEDMGRVSTINENKLIHDVKMGYLDTLSYMSAVDSILEKNQEFSKKKQNIIEATSQEMSALEDRRWDSDDVYITALNQVKEKRESELAALKKHFLLQKIIK